MENDQEDNQLLLMRVRLVLEEGQSERARGLLERIDPENDTQQQEIKYLRAWSYILDECWNEAELILTPLALSIEAEEENTELSGRERLRRGLCFFQLGNAAVNLSHFEDASRHYAKCLRLLKDRRFQSPKLAIIRIRARYSLGMTCIERGLYPSAKQHYEDALRLYNETIKDSSVEWRVDLAHIYYGFCDIYRKTGKLLEALEEGKRALGLYDDLGERLLKGRVNNHLGHIYMQLGEYREASDQFTASLAVATTYDRPGMIMINCSALAKLRMNEGRLKEALDYCKLAMDWTGKLNNDHLSGLAYLTTGVVIQADASQSQGEQMHERMKDALRYFRRACEHLEKTQAYDKLAEAEGRCAEVLEILGRTQEALAYWNSAYKAQADSFGPTWF